MKYKVYFRNSQCNVLDDESRRFIVNLKKGGNKKPKDTTELSFSIDTSMCPMMIDYEIANPSSYTQHLIETNQLALAVFVKEYDHWKVAPLRGPVSNRNHPNRRCLWIVPITNLSSTIDIYQEFGYTGGVLSKNLSWKFRSSSYYQDPYVESGIEYIAIGLGRYNSKNGCKTAESYSTFRPYVVSGYEEYEVMNEE